MKMQIKYLIHIEIGRKREGPRFASIYISDTFWIILLQVTLDKLNKLLFNSFENTTQQKMKLYPFAF